jgi:hypothetical protein
LFIAVALICVLVPAFGVVYPVRATVKDASVSRLAGMWNLYSFDAYY